jgi:fluoride exporter
MSMVLAVACGGALGAVGRYLISSYMQTLAGNSFPWGTLVVNVLGCAILGTLVTVFAHVWSPSQEMRAFLTVGMMGALTTFSAFSLEVVLMIERAQWVMAGGYVAASVILCVAAILLSMAGMRALL